jgi:nitrite reductase/ring-hydroxylating ferredoxin subunit/alkylhydroperoxidase/carboxymuconolactone decarboxylase family protein YurZ
MSDALNFLVKARPDALGPYFKFLKACGTHLDPKTRDLISVITKVHSQTERGFRQYLKRALRDGCTAMEILDALLMAFPALGLTKIVWATDIILAMNLPEFQLDAADVDAADEEAEWHDLIAADALESGETSRIDCEGRSVFIHRERDSFRVYDSRCPHQTTNIPQLALVGSTLTCPKHQWTFDIRSGDCIAVGDTPLRCWECKVEGGRLLAQW